MRIGCRTSVATQRYQSAMYASPAVPPRAPPSKSIDANGLLHRFSLGSVMKIRVASKADVSYWEYR